LAAAFDEIEPSLTPYGCGRAQQLLQKRRPVRLSASLCDRRTLAGWGWHNHSSYCMY
jgi:hypothetical protein